MDEDTPSSAQPVELLLACVVHVIDPTNFWIQLGNKELFDHFDQLEDLLQAFCEETGCLEGKNVSQLEDKCFVVAKSKVRDSGVWRRAQVARQNIERGTVDVFYLDYGTTEIVHLHQICAAVPAFFFAVDNPAWMCGLAGIKPIAKTWTSRGTKFFKKITKDVLLQACVISYHQTFSSLQIALYTNEGGDGHSLAHQMLEEEMGLPSDLENVAEYARDVTQVVPQYRGVYIHTGDDATYDDHTEASHEETPCPASQDQQTRSQNTHQTPTDTQQTDPPDSVKQMTDNPPQTPVSEPESPGAVIPGFNLNSIFKTKLVSADLIEQKKEDARKKAVTTAMEKDLELVQKDMEEVVPKTEVTEWGMSDYDIGKQQLGSKLDVCYQKVADIREVIGDASWSPSMTEGHGPHKPVLQEMKASQVEQQSPRPSAEKTPLNRSQGPNKIPEVDKLHRGSPTPGERLESSLSKQLAKILDEGNLEDLGSLHHQISSVVQPGGLKEPCGLAVVIEVLLETAITLGAPQQANVLSVLDTYADSANFDVRLQTVLRKLDSRFVKPSFGAAKTYYKDYGQVLGQLLIMSRLWNSSALEVTETFVIHQLEKWAIFNRNGYQMGVQNEKTQQVYTECLEGLWDVAADTIQNIDSSTFVRVQEWLQDKVLAQSHPREIREQVLKLLLKLGPVKVFAADQVRPRTASVEIQTEISSFQLEDLESSAVSHPEDSSLFSHFDTEIDSEDISPITQATKQSVDPSQVPQSSTILSHLIQSPVSALIPNNDPTTYPSHQASDIEKESSAVSKLSSWAHSVNIAKKKPKKTDSHDMKDLKGLRALALQTLNGEKYVFSGRFVQDLPPRFKKHLASQQLNLRNNLPNESHFYRKEQLEETSQGLDYKTPKESSDIPGVDTPETVRVNTPTNDRSDTSDQTSASDDDKSYYARMGLGEFPSVKDILNSSSERTDSGSDVGSERDTPRPRTVTPVEWWNSNTATVKAKTRPGDQRSKTALETRSNTPSPAQRKKSSLNPCAQEWSPRRNDKQHRSSSHSSGGSVYYTHKQKPKQSVSLEGSVDDPHSIKSIVSDIFGNGSGVNKVQSQHSSSCEVENYVLPDTNTETDEASTSFSVSEIESEVNDEKTSVSDVLLQESCDQNTRILPEYANRYDFDDFYDDDDDDDIDDQFFISGPGDQEFKSQSDNSKVSTCVDTGSTDSHGNQIKDIAVNWKEMDYSKPVDSSPAPSHGQRYNWTPGKRKCTLCGDSDHTVYSCKNKKGVIF